jgi:hypothetical protein
MMDLNVNEEKPSLVTEITVWNHNLNTKGWKT